MGQMNKISPCIGVCSIDPKSNLCLGCLRSSDEIAIWPVSYTHLTLPTICSV